jgi:hypothetical protein
VKSTDVQGRTEVQLDSTAFATDCRVPANDILLVMRCF